MATLVKCGVGRFLLLGSTFIQMSNADILFRMFTLIIGMSVVPYLQLRMANVWQMMVLIEECLEKRKEK